MILRWQENLTDDEMPPRWMWELDEDLNDHFKQVSKERKRKYGTDDDDFDDEDDNVQALRPGGMMRNDLAKHRGRNAR